MFRILALAGFLFSKIKFGTYYICGVILGYPNLVGVLPLICCLVINAVRGLFTDFSFIQALLRTMDGFTLRSVDTGGNLDLMSYSEMERIDLLIDLEDTYSVGDLGDLDVLEDSSDRSFRAGSESPLALEGSGDLVSGVDNSKISENSSSSNSILESGDMGENTGRDSVLGCDILKDPVDGASRDLGARGSSVTGAHEGLDGKSVDACDV